METLSGEWKLWALVNGVPAFVGGLLFIGAPLLRRLVPRLGYRPWDWIGHFETRFAWDIASRQDSLLLGVGYIFRGLLFLQLLWATTWVEIRWITWGNVVFAAVLLVVTLVWGDLFHWRRPSAPGWLFLYIEEPVWMLTLVPAAATGAAFSTGEGLPVVLVAALLVEAVVLAAVGLYLFFIKPREPDRVSPRILAGFALGWSFWAAALAFANTWDEAWWGLLLNAIWLGGSVAVLVWSRLRSAGRFQPQASAKPAP